MDAAGQILGSRLLGAAIHGGNVTTTNTSTIQTCSCCGLAQMVPAVPPGMRACCPRCGATLPKAVSAGRSTSRTAALAVAALVLYPLAVGLPMVRIEKFGHLHEASIIEGTITLLGSGHLAIGLIVLLCSVVLPLGKLIALLTLSAGGVFLRREHRAFTYRIVEFTGRWGMLDVLLVAILVAAVKIGDLVEVTPGPAAFAFTCCVVLSLAASAVFDPHSVWRSSYRDQPVGQGPGPETPADSSKGAPA